MGIKTFVIKLFAKWVRKKSARNHRNAVEIQYKIMLELTQKAKRTRYGRKYIFSSIKDYRSFQFHIPVQDYETQNKYNQKIIEGKENICWPGKPIYLAKTSGTTSGAKYIPITKDSISSHINAARDALMHYVAATGKVDFFDEKMIFLQGSPDLEVKHRIKIGRLSGLVYHHVPSWLMSNRMPTYETNRIEDWDEKVSAIVNETIDKDMSVIGGIPPWTIMYFEALLKKSGKSNIKELFPSLTLYVYGGLNYEPYRQKMDALLGPGVDKIETFPASEGFFAYQDSQKHSGLLLNINAGMFFEFVPVADMAGSPEFPKNRISLKHVKLDVQYVLIVSSNAGLWGYNTGDTIKFVSLKPYRVMVTGRLKHFISAFGEHVIAEEVEDCISRLTAEHNIEISEFTVAPYVAENEGDSSYHEWFIEYSENESNISKEVIVQHIRFIDELMQSKNVYYSDLRSGKILDELRLRWVRPGGFKQMQMANGKFGGQNKVQHLANDRSVAKALEPYVQQ